MSAPARPAVIQLKPGTNPNTVAFRSSLEFSFSMRLVSGSETGLTGITCPSLFSAGMITPTDSITFVLFLQDGIFGLFDGISNRLQDRIGE